MRDYILDDLFREVTEKPQGEVGAPQANKPNRSVRNIWDDGMIQRISQIDTSEFTKNNGPTVPGFKQQDFNDQENRIRTDNMGMSNGLDLTHTPAGVMKEDIAKSIEEGYSDLSRGTKIRVLKELMEQLGAEGEERRAMTIKVRRK